MTDEPHALATLFREIAPVTNEWKAGSFGEEKNYSPVLEILNLSFLRVWRPYFNLQWNLIAQEWEIINFPWYHALAKTRLATVALGILVSCSCGPRCWAILRVKNETDAIFALSVHKTGLSYFRLERTFSSRDVLCIQFIFSADTNIQWKSSQLTLHP